MLPHIKLSGAAVICCSTQKEDKAFFIKKRVLEEVMRPSFHLLLPYIYPS